MKKVGLMFACCALVALTFASCKDDCVTCTFGNGQADSEFCGDADERDAFVATQEIAAAFAGTTVDCQE